MYLFIVGKMLCVRAIRGQLTLRSVRGQKNKVCMSSKTLPATAAVKNKFTDKVNQIKTGNYLKTLVEIHDLFHI